MTATKSVTCYAHGAPGQWEAICVDFDIAVTGVSCEDVRRRLFDAIDAYVEAALREQPAVAHRLLNRRSPFWVRWGLEIAYHLHIASIRGEEAFRTGRQVPCPA